MIVFMAAKTDKFIIATFALWAGDFEYFEKLLREFSKPFNIPQIADAVETAEDVIRDTGARRLRQFRQKKGEFRKLVLEFAERGVEITDRPMVVEVTHMRGTIWRIGEREFVMQAYLKDLSWENDLFSRAAANAESKGNRDDVAPKASDLSGQSTEGDGYHSKGCAWVVFGNPFIQVHLTDLGLLEARGMWVERTLPEDAESITNAFVRVLGSLDAHSGEE